MKAVVPRKTVEFESFSEFACRSFRQAPMTGRTTVNFGVAVSLRGLTYPSRKPPPRIFSNGLSSAIRVITRCTPLRECTECVTLVVISCAYCRHGQVHLSVQLRLPRWFRHAKHTDSHLSRRT